MAKIAEDQPLLPSLLDRLIDEEPDNSREVPKSRGQVLREMKMSVRRDLENLLNTRWRTRSWPEDLDRIELSVVNYGIPDFTGLSLGSAENRERLRYAVERVVKHFEPRFKSVRVVLMPNSDPDDRTLRLRIDALLYAEPAPEPVVFDSLLEPTVGTFNVKTETR